MRYLRLTMLFLCVPLFPAWGQAPSAFHVNRHEGPTPWTHLDALNDPSDFQFAIITDRTGGERAGMFQKTLRKVNMMRPEFVMSVGDLIEGYTTDMEQVRREWEELESFLSILDMPFFHVAGNHDISNELMIPEWKERFGDAYYSFLYGDVLFLCLNTEDPPPKQFSAEQIAFVRETLDKHQDVRWTLVFMHVPLWTLDNEGDGWAEVEAMLQERPHTVLAGHYHRYMKTVRQKNNYMVLATSGGGSQLRGPARGEFDHFVWVTMTDDGPRFANVAVDGVWGPNVTTEATEVVTSPFAAREAVQSAPLEWDGELAKTELRVANPGAAPLRFHAMLHPTQDWVLAPAAINATIAPGETAAWPVTARPVHDMAGKTPLRATWEARAMVDPERDELEFSGVHRLVFQQAFECAEAPRRVRVDGVLDEWPALPHACLEPAVITMAPHSWQGPADASFRMAAAHGRKYVYIAAEVYDDTPRFRDRPEPWRKDGFEVLFDARPGDQITGPGERFKDHLYLGFSLREDETGPNPYKPMQLPSGVEAACRKTDAGYTIEAAIPAEYLDELQGGRWERFRINAALHDYDAEYSAPRAILWWQRPWGGPGDFPESGVFHRVERK